MCNTSFSSYNEIEVILSNCNAFEFAGVFIDGDIDLDAVGCGEVGDMEAMQGGPKTEEESR